MKFHCFFEQSGTFKNEFKKLGYEAIDYDIQNEFGETDNVIDLFNEIEKAYNNEESIFDIISTDDYIIAFFPCIRFEHQIRMHFKGVARQMLKWTDIEKLERDMQLHEELHNLYILISKMTIVCLRKNIKLIIENPYSTTHYLTQYWALSYTILDKDRTLRGDYFEKPTQYWFINCKPKYNMILEPLIYVEKKRVNKNCINQTERSLMHPQYANRFIREFILDKEIN